MMSAPASTVSMLMAYEAASDLLFLSILDYVFLQEFSGAMPSTDSSSVVPLAPSDHVAKPMAPSALQLTPPGLQTMELRLDLALKTPSVLVHTSAQALFW